MKEKWAAQHEFCRTENQAVFKATPKRQSAIIFLRPVYPEKCPVIRFLVRTHAFTPSRRVQHSDFSRADCSDTSLSGKATSIKRFSICDWPIP